ncbi:uncharacterized protein LOC117810285 isoform X2 [Xyrichtys novacula]|uniref:Uncharacterized protein LOC117810285 isoform X2 n=1 Tax=Xyrichtys novacula TaxID=13765 RepID=A0AAV1EJA5_XYRNO|nr:uncharacterized protein LOC117810285 isoform X2 [Xyrichtys novacula]
MATQKEEDSTTESSSPTEEDTAEDLLYETPERKHAHTLIDDSEEELLKEQEPSEYHCYTGWEEAVQCWSRVDPLSCILLTPKMNSKVKQKEARTLTTTPIDHKAPSCADTSSRTTKRHCEWKSCVQKSKQLNQHTGSWNNTAVVALQKNTSDWPFTNTPQETIAHLSLKEKVEQNEMLREVHHTSTKYSVVETRPSKPQKHSRRPNSTTIPIKNLTFLPPIKLPHLQSKGIAGKKTVEEETKEENYFSFDFKNLKRGSRVDPITHLEPQVYSSALTSTYLTCPYNPHMFSAVSPLIPRRYQVPMSSKADTVHQASYSMGKQVLQSSSTATTSQTRIHPNKTMCAVKLHKGRGINV